MWLAVRNQRFARGDIRLSPANNTAAALSYFLRHFSPSRGGGIVSFTPTFGMNSLPRTGAELVGSLLLTGLLAITAAAQSSPQLLASTEPQPVGVAVVRSVQVLAGGDGAAVEILSSRPLVPSISRWRILRAWRLTCPMRAWLQTKNGSTSAMTRSAECAWISIRRRRRSPGW